MSTTKKPRKTSKQNTIPDSPKNIQITLDSTHTPTNTPPIINETIQVDESTLENVVISKTPENADDSKLHKKRGRKPKGGKLITKQSENVSKPTNISNIVLHLKCSLTDIEDSTQSALVSDPMKYNPAIPPEILSADCFTTNELKPSLVNDIGESKKFAYFQEPLIPVQTETNETTIVDNLETNTTTYGRNTASETADKISTKEINAKLKRLKMNLYKNECSDKRAACFWCTYDFDSPPVYIPKYEMDQTIYGYGSFCRPECAAAFLMKENIDDSTKFERYYLLNQMYGKIFGYEKNIKLAPNPYYLLDKYYGNLTIQEYRKLLKLDHMLIVLEKPMTRVLPELHEDNDSINLNTNTINVNGNYKVKRQSEKQGGPSKTSIIRDCFNL